jgi:GAF domain-containing protein
MRRGAKPAKAKGESKRPVARKSGKGEGSRAGDLETRLAEALKREAAALENQTATSEILRTIAHAQSDVQPVFDTIVRSAARLCHAVNAAVFLTDGTMLYHPANYGSSPEALAAVRAQYPKPLDADTTPGRAILTRSVVQVPDIEAPSAGEHVRQVGRLLGFRGVVAVPMLRDGEAVGAINVSRREPGSLSGAEVELLKTFADQAVIAIENVRLFKELQDKNQALTAAHAQVTEALQQQTATSEILRVISSSPTDLQPVFEAIVHSAGRLCDAAFGALQLYDGERLTLDAHYGISPEDVAMLQEQLFPMHPDLGSSIGRAVVRRAIVHIEDIRSDPEYHVSALQAREGYRTALSVPMLRGGVAVGVINLWRREVRPFSQNQIEMVQTFADQAVIAIENVRLFKELQEKTRVASEAHAQVSEALARETATSEILRVIGSSLTDPQPVFEAIARSGLTVCAALGCVVFVVDDDMLRVAATAGVRPERVERFRRDYPISLSADIDTAQAVRDRRMVHLADIANNPNATANDVEVARLAGYSTRLMVPMVRGDRALGLIAVTREDSTAFPDQLVELLRTFADQAVIAIENVRLFTELQASNRELTSALDQQTATSDILRVINQSQTNIRPVFDAIVASAVRLLGGYTGALTRIEGDQIEIAALTGHDAASDAAVRAAFPQSLQSEETHAQAIRNRAPLKIADYQTDPRLPEALHASAGIRGYRSLVVVPMLHHDEAVGAIGVTRRDSGGFTGDEIALLKTFADQAVIAIENVRLFRELQARTTDLTRSVEQLTALGEVGRAVSSTLDLETVLTTIVSRAVQLSGLDGGVVFEYDQGAEEFVQRAATETGGALAEARRTTRIRKGEGVLGQTAITLEPFQVPDITVPGAHESRLREILIESGVRAVLAVPMVREGELIGCLGVTRNHPGEFPPETIELLRTFATQSALAIQNARLFHEIEDKGRQLEVASQHKSEFLANMSHELRTPLNAVIGFSEVLLQRMFGELNAKQDEYLQDIYASGQHLLSLINDILDLSKIEAGRMELELVDFDFPTALDNTLTLIRERAGRRGIALHLSIDERLGQMRADERKIRQIVLNLLSNAIKFTPEGGRIEVAAVPRDEFVEVSVSDTGIGIAPEDQEAVFEEFRQVGTADKKVEGTGLGLSLSRKFIELHGGRIWVQSQVGIGSTFTFSIPVRRRE